MIDENCKKCPIYQDGNIKEKRCWICGRTKEELIRDDRSGVIEEHIDEKKDILIEQDSAKWTTMPYVCRVCLMIITEHMINEKVVFEDELNEFSFQKIKRL